MGKHTNPRRNLTAPPEDFERWDELARKRGKSWAEWVRSVLNRLVAKDERKRSNAR